MNYPLLSEYIESIKSAEDNFEQLKHLRPVLGEDGEPVMSSGNFAVVFKMRDERSGKLHAVKCFLKEQEGRAEAYRMIAEELEYVSSTFLTPFKYLDNELFVDTTSSDETEFPVLLMDWVEGLTLDKYIREHIDDQYELSLLAYQFSRLAMWLMPQPFAHGDLKPDNILVRDDGTLVLVDYDGMYVPAMKGQKARELGSPDFRHPSRTENDFDEHIDDFSLASILLSLKAISLQPELLKEYGATDRLIFSVDDYRNLSESKAMDGLKSLMQDAELASLYSLFILALSQNNLSQVSFRLFNLSRPERSQYDEVILSTEVTEEDLANAWTDEYGVKYSKDRKRLLKAPRNIIECLVEEGTMVICDDAFYLCDGLSVIKIPQSVKSIGDMAFCGCESLTTVLLPKKLKKLSYKLFCGCESLVSIAIPNGIISIGEEAFSGCEHLSSIIIPKSVEDIGKGAFSYTDNLKTISVNPENKYYDSRDNCNAIIESASNTIIQGCASTVIPLDVEIIGPAAFMGIINLLSISLPNNVKIINNDAFCHCESLNQITIPESVTHIGDGAFAGCKCITSISIPKNTKEIGIGAFAYNDKLESIRVAPDNLYFDSRDNCNAIIESTSNTLVAGCASTIIPNSVITIGEDAFRGCNIISLTIPDGVTSIETGAFFLCKNLECIHLPNSLTEIGNFAFSECKKMISISIPDSVCTIGKGTFMCCKQLEFLRIPMSTKEIQDRTFFLCEKLDTVIFHKNIRTVGESVFYKCKNIRIVIPKGSSSKYEYLLPQYKDRFVEQDDEENLSTEVTEEDLANAWVDNSGVKYSIDGKRLLKAPNYLNNYSIREGTLIICDEAFSGLGEKSNLRSIWIPDSVIAIGNYAFSECPIANITLPNYVRTIGEGAFYKCPIIKITIPDTVKKIEGNTFSLCWKLKSIVIPNSVTSIGNEAFKESGLCSIVLPDSVTNIESHAFEDCYYLKSIVIPNSVTRIDGDPLWGCSDLSSIIIPVGVRDKFEKMLPEYYKDIIVEEENGWFVKLTRQFTSEEIAAVKKAEVVASQYGNSVCLYMTSGEQKFIPLCSSSCLAIGNTVDLKTAKIIILSKQGQKDIYRIMN